MRGAMKADQFSPEPLPFVLVAGRSNAGKSSLLNALCDQRQLARVSKTPGRTTEINFFLCNENWFLVDLPGYGYASQSRKKRADWTAPIGALFRDVRTKLVLLLADCRREPEPEEDQIFEMAQHENIPLLMVLTKRDKIGRSELNRLCSRWSKRLATVGGSVIAQPLPTSSKTDEGLAKLAEIILDHVSGGV